MIIQERIDSSELLQRGGRAKNVETDCKIVEYALTSTKYEKNKLH